MLGLLAALGIGGATLVSGLIQSNAASKAAKAQTAANTQATAESERQFNAQMAQYQAEQEAALQRYYSTQSALSPYTQTGTSALLQQRALLGLDPDRQAMIDQANAEYERAVAAARSSGQTQTTSTQTGSTPIIAGYGATQQTSEAKQVALDAIKKYENENPDAWINKNKSEVLKGMYASLDALSAQEAAAPAQEAAAATAQNEASYNAAVSEAEAARQKAIDYANSLPSGSDAQKAAIAAIEQGSEFTTLAKQGEDAILSNASATGGLRGGNTQGALAQFRPSLLNSLINQQYERLGQLSGMGESAILGSSGYSGASTSYPSGQNTINTILNQGSINAGNALAQGNAWSSIPSAFAAGLGAYGAMGGFGSSTYNRGTNNSTSGLTMPYHTAF